MLSILGIERETQVKIGDRALYKITNEKYMQTKKFEFIGRTIFDVLCY